MNLNTFCLRKAGLWSPGLRGLLVLHSGGPMPMRREQGVSLPACLHA